MQVAGCATGTNARYKGPSEPRWGLPTASRSPAPPLGLSTPCPCPTLCLSELLVDLAFAERGFGWGLGSPFERVVRPAALCGNQEHPNEVQIIRLGGREDCCVRDLPLESPSGKTESLLELGSLPFQESTVIREEKPHSSCLTDSLDSFLSPQGSGL